MTLDHPGIAALRRKVAWRIIPFVVLLYFIAYLDRADVGFAPNLDEILRFDTGATAVLAQSGGTESIDSMLELTIFGEFLTVFPIRVDLCRTTDY